MSDAADSERAYGALVDGEWLDAPVDGGWPTVDRALDAASRAFVPWSGSARQTRRELLERVADRVNRDADDLALTMTREIHKPITLARAEVTRLALTFRLAAALLEGEVREELPLDFDARGVDFRCFVERVGIGPVLAIVPYNWPYNLAAHKVAPALAAGNSVLVKPSPLAMRSTLALIRILEECGAPAGVVQAVGCDPSVAERAVADPRIKLVSFTGSEKVGYRVRDVAHDKPVVLELGGDASALVFADADLAWAAKRIALSGFGFAGQVCISAQHARVEAAVYGPFRDALLDATRTLPFGDPFEPATVCGPMIDEAAAERAMRWLDEAVRGGATVLTGGTREGSFFAPTVVCGVPKGCKLATEEVFAPIVCLSSFATEEEAFSSVNASRYGIHASAFTRDAMRIERAFRALEVGGIVVNDMPSLRFDNMPYGGVKRSGQGREGVRFAYEEMTLPKVLLARR